MRGDYKSGRVKDPTTKISSSHEKTIKKYVKEFMDKAVHKKDEREKQKGGKIKVESNSPSTPLGEPKAGDLAMEKTASPAGSATELKRKREADDGISSPKKTRTEHGEAESAPPSPPPPPPPPPPPVEEMPADMLFAGHTPMDDDASTPSTHDTDQGTVFQRDMTNSNASPMQLVTPSTNGSVDQAMHLPNGKGDVH